MPVRLEKRLHFKNPPIVEAAIGVTIQRLPDQFLERLESSTLSSDKATYGQRTAIIQNKFEVKVVGGESTAVTNNERLGWRWESSDKLHVVQFKLDGFAFSRMGRYETWENFIAEAKRLWAIYFSATRNSAFARSFTGYGVRFINKVYLPGGEELSRFLRVYPQMPENGGWVVNNSYMRLAIEIDSPSRGVFVHQHVLVPSDRENFAAVVLDNDFQYPVEGLTEDQLWTKIDEVRDVKDYFFLQVVTPELQETFNV